MFTSFASRIFSFAGYSWEQDWGVEGRYLEALIQRHDFEKMHDLIKGKQLAFESGLNVVS